jgi:hypothetical protein
VLVDHKSPSPVTCRQRRYRGMNAAEIHRLGFALGHQRPTSMIGDGPGTDTSPVLQNDSDKLLPYKVCLHWPRKDSNCAADDSPTRNSHCAITLLPCLLPFQANRGTKHH